MEQLTLENVSDTFLEVRDKTSYCLKLNLSEHVYHVRLNWLTLWQSSESGLDFFFPFKY